jgi:hypothetical protein
MKQGVRFRLSDPSIQMIQLIQGNRDINLRGCGLIQIQVSGENAWTVDARSVAEMAKIRLGASSEPVLATIVVRAFPL